MPEVLECGVVIALAALGPTASHRPYLPRSASFNPPTAFCTLPAALSVFPSASSFLSPRTLPAASFTAPFACSAEPLIRSLSMSCTPCLLDTKDNDVINALFPTRQTIGGKDCPGRNHGISAQVVPTFRARHSACRIKAYPSEAGLRVRSG